MMLIEILNKKLKRRKESFKELQDLIDKSSALSMEKQECFETKGRIQELENIIDIVEAS